MSMNSNKDDASCCDVTEKPKLKTGELEASKTTESKLTGSPSEKPATPAPKSGCC